MRTPRIVTSKNPKIEARRAEVARWVLSGYCYKGKILAPDEMASTLGTTPEAIRTDMKVLKKHFHAIAKNTPVLQRTILTTLMLTMEMIMQDRGRALEQYERCRRQAYYRDKPGKAKAIVGRDMHELGYQMSAFLKLAQDSTNQLTKLMSLFTSGDVTINLTDNSTNTNILTTEQAVKLLETKKAMRALPTSSGVHMDMDDMGDIIEISAIAEAVVK